MSQSPDDALYNYEVAGHVYVVPLLDIYVDTDFNCRGHFDASEVFDLAQDIKTRGQLTPLIIQPMEDVPEDERPVPAPWKFRLVAGHRRYTSMQRWLKHTEANCCIEVGLTKQQAHVLNFTENRRRKDLNIFQEAESLQRSWPGIQLKQLAKLVGESKRWVKVRQDLMKLPEYIQQKAATGQLSQYDIEILAEVDEDEIESTFQQLVTTKGKTGRAPVIKGRQTWRNRPRGKMEIEQMINFLYTNSRFSDLDDDSRDYIVSTLAWVLKGIDAKEFLENRLGFPTDCVIVDSNDKVGGLKDDE